MVACLSEAEHSGFSVEILVGLSWFSCPFPFPFIPLLLLIQCDRCPDDYTWGLMAGLRGLPAMGGCYCLGAGWSQWRPLDFPGTLLPLRLMQLLIIKIIGIVIIIITIFNLGEGEGEGSYSSLIFPGYSSLATKLNLAIKEFNGNSTINDNLYLASFIYCVHFFVMFILIAFSFIKYSS